MHAVHLGKQPERLQRFDELVSFGRADRPAVEDVRTQADRHAHQGGLLDDRVVGTLHHVADQQANRVGTDVDGGVCEVATDGAKVGWGDRMKPNVSTVDECGKLERLKARFARSEMP